MPRRSAAFWAVLGIGLAVGLANVAKPVHIDDTLYLTIARWIAAHPLDPYGGMINWQQVPEPTYNVSISPPLLSYVFALVIAIAGENVPLLHVAMIPWILVACWALYRLGERWAGAGAATALLVILGPAVVAGMNLMLDVPLLACVCAAVECLLRGIERRSAWWFLAAGSIGAVGVLIKYPALALVPLFVVAAVRRRRWGPLVAVLGPLAAVIAWQAASRSLYGASQVHAGLSFLGQFRTMFLREVAERTVIMFALLAWTFLLWVVAPSRLSWRGWIGAAVAALLALKAAVDLGGIDLWVRSRWVSAAFLVGVGLGMFGLAASVLPGVPGGVRPRTADDPRPLLWAWVLGIAAIVIPFGPFVAVRSFLPLQPPLVLLFLSRRVPSRGALAAAIALTAMLSASLAVVDFRWAASYPAAARRIKAQYGAIGRPIAFLGHWGWQYYAEREGFQPWDARWLDVPVGTIVVLPERADRQMLHPDFFNHYYFHVLEQIAFPPGPMRMTTWNRGASVRFYGGDFGELPWGFSSEATEQFWVCEVRRSSMER